MKNDFEATKILTTEVEKLSKLGKDLQKDASGVCSAASAAQNRYDNTIKPKLENFETRLKNLEKKK